MLSSCIDAGGSYFTPTFKVKVKRPSQPFAEETSYERSIITKHELDVLKDIPNNILVEREAKCQNCVKAHASTLVSKLKLTGEFSACDKRKMLLYGHCPDFESVDVLDIQTAANGVE